MPCKQAPLGQIIFHCDWYFFITAPFSTDSYTLIHFLCCNFQKIYCILVKYLIKEGAGENSSVREAERFAVDLLHQLIQNPITIDFWYTEKSGYLKNLIEEKVITRLKKLLDRWKI